MYQSLKTATSRSCAYANASVMTSAMLMHTEPTSSLTCQHNEQIHLRQPCAHEGHLRPSRSAHGWNALGLSNRYLCEQQKHDRLQMGVSLPNHNGHPTYDDDGSCAGADEHPLCVERIDHGHICRHRK